MVYRMLLCLALILSGCAVKPPAPVAKLPSPPPDLQSCPAGAARRSRRPHRAPWRSSQHGPCRRITHARRRRTPGANAPGGSIVYNSGSASTPAKDSPPINHSAHSSCKPGTIFERPTTDRV